jgi:hypothetical protein
MKYTLISLVVFMCSGCVSLATSVATQAGVQIMGEQYLITQKKPIIRCNVVNVVKGNKVCRVYRQYKK